MEAYRMFHAPNYLLAPTDSEINRGFHNLNLGAIELNGLALTIRVFHEAKLEP